MNDAGGRDVAVEQPDHAPDSGDSGVLDYGPQLALSEASACFRRSGQVWCWGWNGEGTLGDGTLINRSVPTLLENIAWVNELASDDIHVCARLATDSVMCWGLDTSGDVGIGVIGDIDASTAYVVTPTLLDLNDIASLSSRGAGRQTCATGAALSAYCWGPNAYGELPGLVLPQDYPSPILVPALSGANAIATGDFVTCAIFNGGIVRCSGNNNSGQLGDGTTTSRGTLADVVGVTNAVELAMVGGAGAAGVVALLNDGSVIAWGTFFNSGGPLPAILIAQPVLNLTNVVEVVGSAGGQACARIVDGTVKCWGINSLGQLGDGTTTSRATPEVVPNLLDVVDVAAGADDTCAVVKNGSVYCWGDNRFGQMGNGGFGQPSLTPSLVMGL